MWQTRRLTRAPPLDTELHALPLALPLPFGLACGLEPVDDFDCDCDCTVTGERPEPGVDAGEAPDAGERALATATRGDCGVEDGATGAVCFAV